MFSRIFLEASQAEGWSTSSLMPCSVTRQQDGQGGQGCVQQHLLADECLPDENGQNDGVDEHAAESRYNPLREGQGRMTMTMRQPLHTWGMGLPRKSLREQEAASGAAAVTPTAATASFRATTSAATCEVA
jgi:hypothetical protein